MKKIISLLTFISIVTVSLVSIPSFPNQASAQNIGSLKSVVTLGFSFKKDLMFGDTDPDVKELQKVLNADIDTMIISTDAGSPGKETTYFGSLTKTAVIKFQEKYRDVILTPYGLTVGDGKVSKPTRTKLNTLIGVINTYDSVGLPQSRAGSASTPAPTYTPPVSTPTTGYTMSTCQFIELLISIEAIIPGKENDARRALSCAVSTVNDDDEDEDDVFVNLKVDGMNGPLELDLPKTVSVTWTSSGVRSCRLDSQSKSSSGSESIRVSEETVMSLKCKDSQGDTVSDSVVINDSSLTSTLTASCSASSTAIVDQSVTWRAAVSGGSTYQYNWDGDNNLSGTAQTITKSYSTTGAKRANVTVVSGSETKVASCTINILAGQTASSSATSTATTSAIVVDITADGESGEVEVDSDNVTLDWTSNGSTCTASSTPQTVPWSGVIGPNGSLVVSLLNNLFGYIGFTTSSSNAINSSLGSVIEKGMSIGPTLGYLNTVNFTKPGSAYPDDLYVQLSDGRKCSISDPSVVVTDCVSPLSTIGTKFELSCSKYGSSAVATSSVKVFRESTTTPAVSPVSNSCSLIDYNTGGACPAGYVNCDSHSHCGTKGNDCSVCDGGGNSSDFKWDPIANNGKAVVYYGLQQNVDISCDYENACEISNFSLPYDKDWTFEIQGNISELPDCPYPRLFFANGVRESLEIFSNGGNQVGFRLANKKISFESATVGTIRNPGEDTDHYAIAQGSISKGTHTFRVQYRKSANRARLFEDNQLIGDWQISINSIPDPITSISMPGLYGLFNYNYGSAVDNATLNGDFSSSQVSSSCSLSGSNSSFTGSGSSVSGGYDPNNPCDNDWGCGF